MKLSKDAIEDYKKIYFEKRGVKLTDEEADHMGWQLLTLAKITLKNDSN